MKTTFRSAIFSFVLSLPLSVASAGDHRFTWCDGCSVSDIHSKAIAFGRDNGIGGNPQITSGTIYLIDRMAGSVNKFYVTYPVAPVAHQQEPEPEAYAATEALLKFYSLDPIGMQKTYYYEYVDAFSPEGVEALSAKAAPKMIRTLQGPQPVHVLGVDYPDKDTIAYDVANPGPKQNQFLDNLSSKFGTQVNSAMDSLARSMAFFRGTDYTTISKLATQVTFVDGSKLTVVLDTSATVPKLVIDTSSLRDSHNNTIPVTKHMVSGDGATEYDFRGPGNAVDPDRMVDQIRNLGVPVNVNPGHWVATMVCSSGTCDVKLQYSK